VDFLGMEILIENIITYGLAALVCALVIYFYLRRQSKRSSLNEAKIVLAKQEGIYEPVSLHPVVDPNSCIKTGACIAACPEKDILGIVNGKATTINASHCVGHGACFHACPTQAITLCIGTERRGVELPHVNQLFESNVPGIYIAGELGGMGLIKNAVEQGRQAVENIARYRNQAHTADYDLLVVGAGPAGISATLTAKKHKLRCITLEQDTLGGTVYTFPRAKIVMTSAMDLPLYGKVKLFETSKSELLDLWHSALSKNDIRIRENAKVVEILPAGNIFTVKTSAGESFSTHSIVLAIGRRGSPRKLGVPGEDTEKVAYRLLEPELIQNKKIVVVGGGDSAIESALLLADSNKVMLSYRGDAFSRLKPKNAEKIQLAAQTGKIDIRLNSTLSAINPNDISLKSESGESTIPNDMVFIFAGGELPTQFLEKTGIQITKKYGEAILKH
jgi:thioredoxin reductase/Pyruvate/2-oxoacid:ferredoxin oxidoreductase delta subunit